jgi:hypothetical protein
VIEFGPFVLPPVAAALFLRFVVFPWARNQEWWKRIEDFFQPVDDEELEAIRGRKPK